MTNRKIDEKEIILTARNEDIDTLYSIINDWSIALYLHIKNEVKLNDNRKKVHIIGEKEAIKLLQIKIKQIITKEKYDITVI
ncbi:MAG: hypothetical protein ACOC1K_08345 [Nanoarchaeota archaeon]